MLKHRLLIAVSLAILSAPVAAETPAEAGVQPSTNGEFLFKHYPKRALAAREQGRVGFRVTLDEEGSLTSCEVTQSSGHSSLDSETCELVVRYARFQRVRDEEGRFVRAAKDGFVNWKLPKDLAASGTVRKASGNAGPNPDKIICRGGVRTGSLVATERRCMTRREWALSSGRAQQQLGELQGGGSYWDGRD